MYFYKIKNQKKVRNKSRENLQELLLFLVKKMVYKNSDMYFYKIKNNPAKQF